MNASLLSNYDALFVLTPVKDIPDDEAQAIIDWVKSGGQLVITQNGTGTYANEITAEFGIEFDGTTHVNQQVCKPPCDDNAQLIE